jgi:hypothetical protein
MPRGLRRGNGEGRVDRGTFFKAPKPMSMQELESMNGPYIHPKTGERMNMDNAPAGGIPRPKMHGCLDCGTPTPSDNGDTCVDCTNDRDEASAESWARNQRADAVKGMFGYPR